jgi:decaprenyl-phosphate phosphoribosyltransferase
MSTASAESRQVGAPKPLTAVVRSLRPRQWIKNLIVVAAPVAAGVLFEPEVLGSLAVAFVSFSLLASALYLFNDVIDIESDRLHPTKRLRPVAAGEVSVPFAIGIATVFGLGSFLLAALALPIEFVVVLGCYVLNTATYTVWGKHEPVLDMLQVAAGFVLRAVAGAVAVGLPMSQWFLGVAMFGSLLMVSGKRTSEKIGNGEAGRQRKVLDGYSVAFLEQVMTIAACALLITYALWAFGDSSSPIGAPWDILSLAPFAYSVLHYLRVAETGSAEEPEDLALTDKRLQTGAAVWLLVIVAGVYL